VPNSLDVASGHPGPRRGWANAAGPHGRPPGQGRPGAAL